MEDKKMKNYRALYRAARGALSKIAGETLFLDKEPQSQEADEELLKALSAALNNRAGNGEVNPPTETVEDGEVEKGDADLFTQLNMERLKRLNAKIAARKKQEKEELQTDWQATVKQMQAYASTVTDLLDEMEQKK